MGKDIVEIKKKGKLIAMSPGWQYWLVDDVLYSVSSTGLSFNVWCAVSELNAHLHHLYQVTGSRYFTQDPTMQIVDKEFVSKFSYA